MIINTIKTLDEISKAIDEYSGLHDSLELLKEFIEAKKLLISNELESCPECESKPMRVFGGTKCKTCGIPGTCPWGG